ncbi:MAG TPA: RodZ domain-containing protein [Vicinamibacterales bacterium]|nr:RodZ domain-containing protein [Vicinamibacterales bacterium]
MAHRAAPAVGLRLRSVREAKGISLRQVAATTKIGTPALEAVERGEFSRLPGGIYTRAIIRSYAEALGLHGDEILSEFIAECPGQIDPVPSLETPEESEAARAPWASRLLDALPAVRTIVMPFGLAIAAAYAALWWTTRPEPVLPSSPVEVLAAQGLAAVPVEPVITHVARMVSAGVERSAVAGALTIELVTHAECWVSLVVDGAGAESRLLEAGERLEVAAEREIELKVGDAGAVALWINGKPAAPLGESGRTATLRISADDIPRQRGS